MTEEWKKRDKEAEKEKVRTRVRVSVDPDKVQYFPEKKRNDYYDNDVCQRVAIYVRVSTGNVDQTTSYELKKRYYEDFVVHHPNWTLVGIYADEGISGTSRRHRDGFNRMIGDCKAGKIDMIICKNVSRFARNVTDCIGIVRDLAALKPPVGVFFESECIFSLRDDSQMGLAFLATMAEEESHTRSRSMETSLRMRLDNGMPLTPKLLGYTHNADGQLVINEDEAPTVKLAFYMYLYGYSTQQIADAFNTLGKRSYLGNVNWTSNGIVQILRNERHCGDVLTRKTFTPNYRDHLPRKNRGDRPQSRYLDHHQPIISRDDFIAIQRMLDNSKFRNRSILPELRVIDSGILRGFVVINPRWSGFKEEDYYQASMSAYPSAEELEDHIGRGEGRKIEVVAQEGDFDLRGFEIARSELFDSPRQPAVSFYERRLKFTAVCVERFAGQNYVELLINPVTRMFAVRPTAAGDRNGVYLSKYNEGKFRPREIPAAAFIDTLYNLFGWSKERKYRIIGSLYEKDGELAYVFDAGESETYFKPFMLEKGELEHSQPLTVSGKRIRAIPAAWSKSFGKQFYLHERPLSALAEQSEGEWRLMVQGELFETGKKLKVTDFDELRSFIQEQLGDLPASEVEHNGT